MKIPAVSLGLAALLCSASPAAEKGGIHLPQTRDGLPLHGAGVLRKGYFFRIYVGALYAEAAHTDRILTEVPKRIDIHFFHHTPKKHMVRTAEKTLRKNLPDTAYETLLPKIKKLHAAFRDGEEGSCASILYEPGEGLTYLFDGEPVVIIAGDDFANAYFSVWLGERPSSRSMKEAMLNKESL